MMVSTTVKLKHFLSLTQGNYYAIVAGIIFWIIGYFPEIYMLIPIYTYFVQLSSADDQSALVNVYNYSKCLIIGGKIWHLYVII